MRRQGEQCQSREDRKRYEMDIWGDARKAEISLEVEMGSRRKTGDVAGEVGDPGRRARARSCWKLFNRKGEFISRQY